MPPSKKRPVKNAEIVHLFAERLRERRHAMGMTQEALAHAASVTPSYLWRLESGGASPGIDLVARLAGALGTTAADLLPSTAPPDTLALQKEQARKLFDQLLDTSDREMLSMLNSLLFRLSEAQSKGR
jgi:transcriptional regulator with XRE-family HTH domain